MADNEKKVSPDSGADKATAEEKAAAKVAKAAKGKKNDKPNFFVRAKKGSRKFFKDFKGECKKIDWPDAKTVLKSTGVVLLVVAIVSVFVFALDFGLKEGIEQLKLLAIGEVTDGNVTDGDVVEEDEGHTHADGSVHYGDHDEEETEAETTEAETTEAETTEAETEDTTAEDAE